MKIKKFNQNVHVVVSPRPEPICEPCQKILSDEITIRIKSAYDGPFYVHPYYYLCLDCFRKGELKNAAVADYVALKIGKCIVCNRTHDPKKGKLLWIYNIMQFIHEDCIQKLIEDIDKMIMVNEQEYVAYRL